MPPSESRYSTHAGSQVAPVPQSSSTQQNRPQRPFTQVPLPLGAPCTHHFLFGSGCEKPAACIEGVCQYHGARTCPEY